MKNFLLIGVLLFSGVSNVFSTIDPPVVSVEVNKPADWTIYFDHPHFSIEFKFVECDPKYGYDAEYILLRFKNKTDNKLTLEWHTQSYYDGACKTCDYPEEYTFSIGLPPNAEKTGECLVETRYRQLKIFSRFTDSQAKNNTRLTAFKLANLNPVPITK